jgi:hypothetical protein
MKKTSQDKCRKMDVALQVLDSAVVWEEIDWNGTSSPESCT